MRRLNFVTAGADLELLRIREKLDAAIEVRERGDLERALGDLACTHASQPCTLDLIGHSDTRGILQLGDFAIDASRRRVLAFFRGLADAGVLESMSIREIRLLGCQTADTVEGRKTIAALRDATGLSVVGTTQEVIYSAHFDHTGFSDDCAHVLRSTADTEEHALAARGAPFLRTLDLEMLPTGTAPRGAWPRHDIAVRHARGFLATIDRTLGALMPGALLQPICELAIACDRGGAYVLHVLSDCRFVRAYPDGYDAPGVFFPVREPAALAQLLRAL